MTKKTNASRENHHVIDVLVSQLDNGHQEVAAEAVVALTKFVCEDNYLCWAHSKRMIEYNAVQPMMKLLRVVKGHCSYMDIGAYVLPCLERWL